MRCNCLLTDSVVHVDYGLPGPLGKPGSHRGTEFIEKQRDASIIGTRHYIEIEFGLSVKTIEVEVSEYLGDDEYVLEDIENRNLYIRKLTWEKLDYV